MKRGKHLIMGIHITDRVTHAGQVQEVLTQHGANIKTRLGLHETAEIGSPANGLIMLELTGDEAGCQAMGDRLNAIDGIEVQTMVFEHPA